MLCHAAFIPVGLPAVMYFTARKKLQELDEKLNPPAPGAKGKGGKKA